MKASKSRRPYLIRAIYDWCVDNGHTPHLLVAADYPSTSVPRDFVQEGRITLNISPMAIQSLDLQSDPIWFSARFGGKAFDVLIPTGAVLAVFARENGEGVVFGEVEPPSPSVAPVAGTETPPPKSKPGGRAHLKVVK